MSAESGCAVPDYSVCCLRPSWGYLVRALEAEAERVRAELTEELLANGHIVADNRFLSIYEALGPKRERCGVADVAASRRREGGTAT